eukprot:5968741-Karenia_brevis.AAC.1
MDLGLVLEAMLGPSWFQNRSKKRQKQCFSNDQKICNKIGGAFDNQSIHNARGLHCTVLHSACATRARWRLFGPTI